MTRRDRQALRAASVLAGTVGLGFGTPALYAMWHLRRGNDIPLVLGYPTYGRAVFERHGVPTTVPLLSGFLVVCAAECVVARSLWRLHPSSRRLAIAVLPFEITYWIGFSLPYGLVAGAVRAALVAVASPVSRPRVTSLLFSPLGRMGESIIGVRRGRHTSDERIASRLPEASSWQPPTERCAPKNVRRHSVVPYCRRSRPRRVGIIPVDSGL